MFETRNSHQCFIESMNGAFGKNFNPENGYSITPEVANTRCSNGIWQKHFLSLSLYADMILRISVSNYKFNNRIPQKGICQF